MQQRFSWQAVGAGLAGGLVVLVVALLLGATSTRNPFPAFVTPTTDSPSRAETFLRDELPYALSTRSAGYIVSGGTGSTSANLTHTITAMEGRTFGYYISQGATSRTYTASRRTFVYGHQDGATPASFTITGGTGCTFLPRVTHLLFVECSSGSYEPDKPANSLPLMAVDTDGTAITTVTDLRPLEDAPLPSIDNYTSLAAAVTALGSTNTTLTINRRTLVSSGTTIPATTTLKFVGPGRLDFATGITVTYLGSCRDWPLTQHFSTDTTGVVSFNPAGGAGTSGARCTILYPQWWGANGDGSDTTAVKDANTLAFNRMFSAAPNSTADGATPSPGRGAIIRIPAGIYRTSGVINGVSYVTVEGDGWRNTAIIADTATLGNNPIVQCTDCRWSDWRDFAIEASGPTGNTNQHCLRFTRTASFGNKMALRNMAMVHCFDGVNFVGDATNISMAHMYIRNVRGNGLHFVSGAFSGEFRNMYITNPSNRGIWVEGSIGKSVFENIVTELTGNDGIYLTGDSNTLSGIYIGDQAAATSGNGLVLRQVDNTIITGLFIDLGAGGQNAVVLDGATGVEINGLMVGGECTGYLVQWLNGAAVSADLLANHNTIKRVRSGTDCVNGLTNDSTYISFQGVNRVREDIIGASPTTRPFPEGDVRFPKWSIRSPDRPGYAAQTEAGYPRPDAFERWAFLRERFAVNGPTEATSPSYGFYGTSTNNFIGVERSGEDAGASVITGDSQHFDGATVGSWTVTGATCSLSTTTEDSQSGTHAMLFSCTGGTGGGAVMGTARLPVSVTAGQLYRLLWYQRRTTTSCTGCDQTRTEIFNDAETVKFATGPQTKNTFTGEFHELGLYFQPTAATHRVLITMRDSGTGTNAILLDTIRLQPIRSSGAMTIGGGRKADTTSGQQGGAFVRVHGDDHASRPGELTLNSRFGVGIPTFTAAALPTPTAPMIAICTDCIVATPCAGGGGQRLAIYSGTQWVCN